MTGIPLHPAQSNREQEKPDRAAPVADRFEQKHLMCERGSRTDTERERRQANQQPAKSPHAAEYNPVSMRRKMCE